jgi:hypothetical protein|tara:strand:+ start:754 stop:1215 length:462 start_codon:yes stop_codon:yes gene_type:complete
MLKFRPATIEDCEALAPNLGEMDRKEIEWATGLDPAQGLRLCYELCPDDCEVAIVPTGEIVSMHGVMDKITHGAPWMLLAKDAYRKAGIRHGMMETIDWVDRKLKKYKRLSNYISEQNTNTIKWLYSLGFAFPEKIAEYGYAKKPFLKFERQL